MFICLPRLIYFGFIYYILQAALPQGIVPFVFAREYGLHPDILSTGWVSIRTCTHMTSIYVPSLFFMLMLFFWRHQHIPIIHVFRGQFYIRFTTKSTFVCWCASCIHIYSLLTTVYLIWKKKSHRHKGTVDDGIYLEFWVGGLVRAWIYIYAAGVECFIMKETKPSLIHPRNQNDC